MRYQKELPLLQPHSKNTTHKQQEQARAKKNLTEYYWLQTMIFFIHPLIEKFSGSNFPILQKPEAVKNHERKMVIGWKNEQDEWIKRV